MPNACVLTALSDSHEKSIKKPILPAQPILRTEISDSVKKYDEYLGLKQKVGCTKKVQLILHFEVTFQISPPK